MFQDFLLKKLYCYTGLYDHFHFTSRCVSRKENIFVVKAQREFMDGLDSQVYPLRWLSIQEHLNLFLYTSEYTCVFKYSQIYF